MKSLYELVGISRQGYHQHRKKVQYTQEHLNKLLTRLKEHREAHPKMGARPMYVMMKNCEKDRELLERIGMNKLEQIMMAHGFRVQKVRGFIKTTHSGAYRFPNRIEGLQITDINQVWVSDITYFFAIDYPKPFYLTVILDLYSKKCLAVVWSITLKTEYTTMPALRMALKNRAMTKTNNKAQGIIFHSDGGGQYYDKGFKELIKAYGMISSMGRSAYENPVSERFHHTLKNCYLYPWQASKKQLDSMIKRFMDLYNNVRPHRSLNMLTPKSFEKALLSLPINQRTPYKIRTL